MKSGSRPQVCFVETTSKWLSVQSTYISGSVKAFSNDKTRGFRLSFLEHVAVDGAQDEDRRLEVGTCLLIALVVSGAGCQKGEASPVRNTPKNLSTGHITAVWSMKFP